MLAPSRDGEILEGKYRLLRRLGEGAMGAVYAGENLRVKRTVAVKILHAAASAIAEMADRFEREAQAAGQIGNDHITEVYDLGTTAKGERYMVLEYLEGETLRSRIRHQKRIEPGVAIDLMLQLLEGLDAAHRAGIIHRDVKPDNIFVVREKAGRRDFVKILDFGISKFTQQVGEGSATRTGTVMGSPNYMSPEHVRGTQEVDNRSDLYSVGVILYEALTGSIPRSAKNFAELLFKIAYEPVPDPRVAAPGLPDALANVVMRACATDLAQRFQSAEEFARALQEASRGIQMPTEVADALSGLLPSAPSSWAGRSQPSFGNSSQSSREFLMAPEPASSSQPSFPTAPPPFGAGSQPSYGAGSQPVFGVSSPSWKNLNPVDAGEGSQPNANGTAILAVDFNASSQPSFVNVGGSTAAPLSVTRADAAEPIAPKKSLKPVALAVAIGVVMGVGGIGGYAYVASSRPAGQPNGAAAATGTAAPTTTTTTVAQLAPDVRTATAETVAAAAETGQPSSTPLAETKASASTTPTTATRPVGPVRTIIRQNTKGPKGPDPGY